MKVIHQTWKGFDRVIIVASNSVGAVIVDVYKTDYEITHKGEAMIWSLFVKKGKRHHGVASQLLERAERYAKEKNCKACILEWNRKDSPKWVLDWYFRRGYEEVEFGKNSSLLKKQLKDKDNDNKEHHKD